MHKYYSLLRLFLSCALCIMICSCGPSDSLQSHYGKDACYFQAFKCLEDNDIPKAKRLFAKAAKKGSSYIALRAAQEECNLGTMNERLNSRLALYNKYKDSNSLLLLCQELDFQREYSRLILLTNEINLEKEDNEICYLRLNALYKKSESRFADENYQWNTSRPFSALHYKLYCSVNSNSEITSFRAQLYSQDYAKACKTAKIISKNPDYYLPQIYSDIGKALLYGSADYLANAYYLENLTPFLPKECQYYTCFYSAKLYDKTEDYKSKACQKFNDAMKNAYSSQTYDNALWYFLNTSLKLSVTQTVKDLKTYCTTWNDPYYFDDFLDTLSVRLLSNHEWKAYYDTAEFLRNKTTKETSAKYNYVSARLIQEGYLKIDENQKNGTANQLFNAALKCDTNTYYALLSCWQLGYSPEMTLNILSGLTVKNNFKADPDKEKILYGYADFGLADKIYDEWQKIYKEISTECILKTALFLKNCSKDNENYYTPALRIAARKVNNSEIPVTKELLELTYPKAYEESITQSCNRFNQPEYLLYALIRSESFFDSKVKSHAGAVGLTQLMESTASDVARKLKIPEYSLTDSSTSILFGSYYLEEMRRRLDGSNILACFAYNGGITRVRSWVKSAEIEFDTKSLPKDIFLEALPFSETREYGRKIITASCMYGILYYNKSTTDIIEEILK